jgi:hypothetical protein
MKAQYQTIITFTQKLKPDPVQIMLYTIQLRTVYLTVCSLGKNKAYKKIINRNTRQNASEYKEKIEKRKESLRRKNENNFKCNYKYKKKVYSNKEVGSFYKKKSANVRKGFRPQTISVKHKKER